MPNQITNILTMIRFSHTLFALPFALLAAGIAWMGVDESGNREPFSFLHLGGILLCMVFARSAGMAFNRIVDRKIDAENPRTADRHLPAGTLSTQSVIWFTFITSIGFILSTLLFLPNWLPLALSGPVLGVLFLYSFTKRFTSLAHFWLGISLMLAPVAAWIAIRGQHVLNTPGELVTPGTIGLAVLFWVAGFDIIYSCQDFEFDRKSKLKSIPVRFGLNGALRMALACHVLMILGLVFLPFSHQLGGLSLGLGWIYWTGITLLSVLLGYEHSLVRADDLSRVNIAFFNVNAVVSIGLFLVVMIDLIY